MTEENGHPSNQDTHSLQQSSPDEVRKYLKPMRDLGLEDLSPEELAKLVAWGAQYTQAS